MNVERLLIPVWGLKYLVTGDDINLDYGDKETIDVWKEENGILEVIPPDDPHNESYFSPNPSFGNACNVVECECVTEW